MLEDYLSRLQSVLARVDTTPIYALARSIRELWERGQWVFLCGNGGSAGNAIHLANDFIYGVNRRNGIGLKVKALAANTSVLTCLANDLGYENIFSHQLAVLGSPGDLLVVFSGSGNSPNILKALMQARTMGIQSYAVLGYSGGRSKELADHVIHFPVDDMQISEDLQLVVGHMVMQWLWANPLAERGPA